MDKSKTLRARKIPGHVWNSHRSTIEGLRQTKELEGEDGIIMWMIKYREFKARYVLHQIRENFILNSGKQITVRDSVQEMGPPEIS
jgi:hypothetical protein